MVTPSDRYGDMDIEDLEEFESLEPDDNRPVDFGNSMFNRSEVNSFDEDFGHLLDETLANMETEDPEWSDEFESEIEAQEYFERYNIEREAE